MMRNACLVHDTSMAYTSDSASDRLSAVRQAIADCLTAQAYTVRGRSAQMAQLRDLRQMEKELQEEVAASNGMSSVAAFLPIQ